LIFHEFYERPIDAALPAQNCALAKENAGLEFVIWAHRFYLMLYIDVYEIFIGSSNTLMNEQSYLSNINRVI
jgi:hypothetical protein